MAGESSEPGSGGTPPPAGQTPPAAAAPQPAAIVVQQKPGVSGLSLDLMPGELRELVEGKSEAEQRMILTNLVNSVKRQNQKIKELESAKTAAPAKQKEEEGEKKPKKSLEERILEAPEDAILEVVNKHFGSRFATTEKNAGEAIWSSVRNEDPDFKQYEDDVRKIIDDNQIEPSRENILGAYTMAIGAKQLEERRRQGVTALNPERAKLGEGAPAQERKFTALQAEIAQAHGMEPKDYYSVDDLSGIKLPENPKPKKAGAA